MALFPFLLLLARSFFAPRLELLAEILALRQQLAILNRTAKKTFHRVVVESCVSADDGNLFDYRLRNDEPVKWVTMMKRQRRQLCRMAGLDGENQKTVLKFTLERRIRKAL
jgi:hypothetical protein